jgi:hypothetical protein
MSQALFLESFKLTSALRAPSPQERDKGKRFSEQWILVLFKDFGETYSSGSVQDLHLIPFS